VLQQLVAKAGPPLGRGPTAEVERSLPAGEAGVGLLELLRLRDGFYAFGNALHVLPSAPDAGLGLLEWNAPGLWRGAYDLDLSGVVFFAQDAFGEQFGVTSEGVVRFDPETGDLETAHGSVADWATAVLEAPEAMTASPSLEAWQDANGALEPGTRLVPTQPFVIGGAFDPENLSSLDAVEGMRVRASVARQLRGLPEGTQVRLTTRPEGSPES